MERGASDGSALRIGWDALYAPLSPPQRAFLDALRALEPEIPSTTPLDAVTWTRLEGQVVRTQRGEVALAPQLLPEPVARAVDAMNRAMQQEIGRRVAVASGYHSPANHTFLFVSLLPVYGHSIRETSRRVALPGRSEHSRPEVQGVDFVNCEGADLSFSRPHEVAELPEFRWLRANAGRFGFALSHPVETPEHAFSPWHWHWEPGAAADR
jgi:LAS superfamily LD-carboxypeptidase LdcB